MSRLTQAVVLLLFGGAVLRASLTDLYLRYVKEGLRPFLIGAGLLLVATGLMTLWHSLRAPGTPSPAAGTEPDDGHGHSHEPRVGWLLILPVLGLLLVAPPALGSFAAGKSGSVAAPAAESDYPPLPAGDPASLSLLDYASRALFDDGRSLTGRTLRMTGFITPGADGSPMLARIVLTCCAADGRPIKVGLTGRPPLEAAANTWVEVTGVYSTERAKDPVNDVDVAYFEVRNWQEIAQPKQPYA
ncbi:TIGR03943 family protein [Paractinoplanes ferrugineus]|uniref:Membrane protein n=1 Tax=Paractinoplanes ferrugineus TaxID=113564 RepID=A0A919JB25_9ACTN|nr:TIGR03943 family protein [Actinoplanes ferrugineus]GIE15999.1 membrane protein [Actinoplanes ferrugineus]